MNISYLRIQYETAVPGGLWKAEQDAGYVMAVGEGGGKREALRIPWNAGDNRTPAALES